MASTCESRPIITWRDKLDFRGVLVFKFVFLPATFVFAFAHVYSHIVVFVASDASVDASIVVACVFADVIVAIVVVDDGGVAL